VGNHYCLHRWVLLIPGCGIVYKLTPNANGSSWTETILYAFFGTSDGANPFGRPRGPWMPTGMSLVRQSEPDDFNFKQDGLCRHPSRRMRRCVFEVKPYLECLSQSVG